MILLLDVGNTRLKWSFFEKGELKDIGSTLYRDQDIKSMLESLWSDFVRPDRVLAASVSGRGVSNALSEYVLEHWNIKAEFIKPEKMAFGVTNAYSEPGKLGVDRWLAMVAAFNKTNVPVCIIDCGSALTIDVVTGEGEHLGGLIIPGLDMMRRSLKDNTEGVRFDEKIRLENHASLLAKNTADAVYGGTLYTLVAMIDRIVNDVSESLDMELSCLITGGDADVISPLISIKHQHVPNLVLEGLSMMVSSA